MELQALRLPRRKLVDKVMKSFLVGNTTARPLLTALEGQLLNTEQSTAQDMEGEVSSIAGKRKHDASNEGNLQLDLLFLGVGDLRNPLITLSNIPSTRPVCFYLNDLSPVTVARNVLLADLAKTTTKENVAAVWYDALISAAAVEALKASIRALLADIPAWLKPFDTATETVLAKYWRTWLKVLNNYATHRPLLLSARNATMSSEDVGHGRAGVSEIWKQTGISSSFATLEESKGLLFNPTLFDSDSNPSGESRFVFLDSQGPGGAFKELNCLVCGTQAFSEALMKVVGPLISHLKNRESVVFKVHCGDCMDFLRVVKESHKFHAVDTSNLMDYLGLFNLLVEIRSVLVESPKSCIVTEMVLSGATTLDDMIRIVFPNETDWAFLLFAYLGFTVKQIKSSLNDEKIVRCAWHLVPKDTSAAMIANMQSKLKGKLEERRNRLRDIVRQHLATEEEREELETLDLSELELLFSVCDSFGSSMDSGEEISAVLKETLERKKNVANDASLDKNKDVLHKCLNSLALDVLCPEPLTEEMTKSPHAPIDLCFRFPTHTALSFMTIYEQIRTLSTAGESNLEGYWEKFASEDGLCKCPGTRNRQLAIKTMRHFVGVRDKTSLNRVLGDGEVQMFTFTVEPEIDLQMSRAGVFEPALAAILINDNLTLNKLRSLNWKYSRGANCLFQHIYYKCTSRKVQILDNVAFDVATNQLTLPMPHRTKIPFTYLVLMDIQRYALISKAIDLGSQTTQN